MAKLIYAEEYMEEITEPSRDNYYHAKCPFCSSQLSDRQFDGFAQGSERYFKVKVCAHCGWWDLRIDLWTTIPPDEYYYHRAYLKHFRDDKLAVPASNLQDYLYKKSPKLFSIHPRQFEMLVASVFKEYLECEVALTPYSKDGGVDLYVLDSTIGPFIVEIKRYSDNVEVSVVRQLVGAMAETNTYTGILVTSSSFSRTAIRYAEKISANPLNPYSITLVDSKELLNFLGLFANSEDFVWPWIKHLDPWMQERLRENPDATRLDSRYD